MRVRFARGTQKDAAIFNASEREKKKGCAKLSNANLKTRLEELLRIKQVSVSQLAKDVGVRRQTISGYITGDRKPELQKIIQIAKMTNTSVDWLLGLTDKRIPNRDFQDACETLNISERVGKHIWKMSHGTDLDKQALDVLVGYEDDYHDVFMTDLKNYLSVVGYCLGPKRPEDDNGMTLPPNTYHHMGNCSVVNTTELRDYLLYVVSERFRTQLQAFPYEKLDRYEEGVVDIPFDNDPQQ